MTLDTFNEKEMESCDLSFEEARKKSKMLAEQDLTLQLAMIERKRQGNCCCLECGDTKFIPVLRFSEFCNYYYVALKRCKCITADEVNQAIEHSGLAEEIKRKTFATFETGTDFQTFLKNIAIKYLDTLANNKRYWFYIGGQSGAGKSHICTAIANRFLQKNYKLFYMKWVDDTRKIKANLSDTGRLNVFKSCQVLYIDDLFKSKPTDYDISVAFEIFNYRENNNLITIISSEYTPSELKAVDEAIYGRIKTNTNNAFMIGIDKDTNKNYRVKHAR